MRKIQPQPHEVILRNRVIISCNFYQYNSLPCSVVLKLKEFFLSIPRKTVVYVFFSQETKIIGRHDAALNSELYKVKQREDCFPNDASKLFAMPTGHKPIRETGGRKRFPCDLWPKNAPFLSSTTTSLLIRCKQRLLSQIM